MFTIYKISQELATDNNTTASKMANGGGPDLDEGD